MIWPEVLLLRKVVASNPLITSVRFAKRKLRQTKASYEFTNNALWRKEKGLCSNPNKFGPLTNAPDYSFLDGRVVPLGSNLRTRLEKQQEYAQTIKRLSGEIDFAKDRYQKTVAERDATRRSIIESKFKPKGTKTLQPPSSEV